MLSRAYCALCVEINRVVRLALALYVHAYSKAARSSDEEYNCIGCTISLYVIDSFRPTVLLVEGCSSTDG